MAKRESRILRTKEEVVLALGGERAVGLLTGAGYKNVENWKREKTIPGKYFHLMFEALRKRRLRASPTLWGMITPEDRQAALRAGEAEARSHLARLAS